MNGIRKTRRQVFAPGVACAGGRKPAQAAGARGARVVPANHALQEEIAALRREQKELHQAIFEAAQVQRKLCAPRELNRGEFEIAGEIFPVRHLSGDFLKVFDLGPVIGLALGDIVGKGLSAGLWLPHLIGLVRICTREHSDPAAAVAEINRELCTGQAGSPMTALFLGRIDPQRGELVYCNAGQPAALLLRKNGAVEALQEGGPMLGAVRDAGFDAGRVMLEPGDTLIACSDGVIECRNPQDEEFGVARLSEVAGAASGGAASLALFSTLGAVLDFAGGRSPGDDVSLLVVHRRAGAVQQPEARPVGRERQRFRGGEAPGARIGGGGRSGMVLNQPG